YIYGQDGHDYIYGHHGNDYLYGGDGNDIIHGYTGNDYIYGGRGNDKLHGNGNNDVLYGGEGNDFIEGLGGNDRLYGEKGNDFVSGGIGFDVVSGGLGNDIFFLRLANRGTYDLDIVTDFTRGDKINVDTPSGADTTLASMKSGANIRWTQNTDYSSLSSVTVQNSNNRYIRDTIIYHTRGTTTTSDDFVLMILEDYNTPLTLSDFAIY
ncbi:MAG: calcium-binding protein, partial [Alphaproteobacteria bacterium]|nr:calcium-binding protein [Alphaproteobacteria bacterium]